MMFPKHLTRRPQKWQHRTSSRQQVTLAWRLGQEKTVSLFTEMR